MSCARKMSAGAPNGSNFHLPPTKPFSGSVHSSRSLPRQTWPPPHPAPLPAAHSRARSSPAHLYPRNRSPSFPRRRPRCPPSHPRSRCPPPVPPAPPHSSQSFPLLPFPPLLPLTPLFRHPTPAATSACHRKSSHPPETAGLPHRSIHTRAAAPLLTPLPHEIPATPAADEIAQFLRDSASLSPRSIHLPRPPHPFPAAAAASAPQSRRSAAKPRAAQPTFVSWPLLVRPHSIPDSPFFDGASHCAC